MNFVISGQSVKLRHKKNKPANVSIYEILWQIQKIHVATET